MDWHCAGIAAGVYVGGSIGKLNVGGNNGPGGHILTCTNGRGPLSLWMVLTGTVELWNLPLRLRLRPHCIQSQRVPGVDPDNSVHGKLVLALEVRHRLLGGSTELPIDMQLVPVLVQLGLQLADGMAVVAVPKRLRSCRCCRGDPQLACGGMVDMMSSGRRVQHRGLQTIGSRRRLPCLCGRRVLPELGLVGVAHLVQCDFDPIWRDARMVR